MSTITVGSMKKSYVMIFHNKDVKRSHFYCFSEMLARSSGIVKARGCVYQEVFKKQLLIIKMSLLLQNRTLKYSTKAVRLYLSWFRFCIMNDSLQ